MRNPGEYPEAGFRLVRVVAIEQTQRTVPGDKLEQEESDFELSWDWAIGGENVFEVLLAVRVLPSKKRAEELKVAVVGRFEGTGTVAGVTFQSFVHVSAPAILFPYVREIVSSLSSRGPFGAMYLPPTNVQMLVEELDFSAATGTKSLSQHAEFAARFGLPPATPGSEPRG